jgi:hypothetical protein
VSLGENRMAQTRRLEIQCSLDSFLARTLAESHGISEITAKSRTQLFFKAKTKQLY